MRIKWLEIEDTNGVTSFINVTTVVAITELYDENEEPIVGSIVITSNGMGFESYKTVAELQKEIDRLCAVV